LFHKIYKDELPLKPCITSGKVKTQYGVPNMVTLNSILGVFKCIFKHRKLDKKIKTIEMVLTFFSMSKLIMHYFEYFLTPQLSISHGKNDFEYVMTNEKFELLLHIISNYKFHHIFPKKKILNLKCHNP